jgi:hypothetical protein
MCVRVIVFVFVFFMVADAFSATCGPFRRGGRIEVGGTTPVIHVHGANGRCISESSSKNFLHLGEKLRMGKFRRGRRRNGPQLSMQRLNKFYHRRSRSKNCGIPTVVPAIGE